MLAESSMIYKWNGHFDKVEAKSNANWTVTTNVATHWDELAEVDIPGYWGRPEQTVLVVLGGRDRA
jgi:hypothetical protein